MSPIIGHRKQMRLGKLLVLVSTFLATLCIVTLEDVYAQEYSIDKKEKYPLAFNQTGYLKNYNDCGYEDIYLTPESVDNLIIEYSLNKSSDETPDTDLTSFDGIDLGLFNLNGLLQEDGLDIENLTQAQVDCLIDIREVEKSKQYKDCGYTGVNTSKAVDQRLSELSMKIIPTTENKTQKDILQQEADCLVDIRSMEKQSDRDNQLGKYQNYEIIDGKVVKRAKPAPSAQGGLDALITDLKNDGEVLKAEIASTNLFKTGLVQNLINKVYYYQGQVSVMGGGTWAYLHDVQDTLIAKIKATGQEGFTIAEQAAIDSFATDAAQDKLEHPSTNVFG